MTDWLYMQEHTDAFHSFSQWTMNNVYFPLLSNLFLNRPLSGFTSTFAYDTETSTEEVKKEEIILSQIIACILQICWKVICLRM